MAVAKMLCTTVCYGSGVPGGLFAPTLFIGATVGGGIGALAQQYWPLETSPMTGYVLVGMGAFFAGVFRAPMTSIFMVFEVSASYKAILPVMVANTLAYLTSRQLHRRAFFDQLAKLEGMELPSHEAQREQRTLRVEDAMGPPDSIGLPGETTVSFAMERVAQGGSVLSYDPAAFWLLFDETMLKRAKRGSRLGEAKGVIVPHVFPDQPLHTTLRRLGGYPLLPVVSRQDPGRLLGVLNLERALDAYGIHPHNGNTGSPHL
jgi:CIC family chloride channel protein